jgi:hypothetical protein
VTWVTSSPDDLIHAAAFAGCLNSQETNTMTMNQIRKHQLNEINGGIAEADLDTVSGGDKKTTTPKPTTKPIEYMVIKLEQVFVSSYS